MVDDADYRAAIDPKRRIHPGDKEKNEDFSLLDPGDPEHPSEELQDQLLGGLAPMGEPLVLPDGTQVSREAAIMGRTYRGEPSNMGLAVNYGQEFQNPAARIFRRGNPMNMAWRLLKEGN
ncbi:MAG: hypothetical protein VW686_10545 [Luminiphilus sp.]